MKKTFLLCFAILFTCLVNAQTILNNPKVGMSTADGLTIVKIEVRDTSTVISFHLKYRPRYWVRIPSTTYLLPVGTKDTLKVVSAEGIPLDQQYYIKDSGEVDYKLTFPRVNSSVSFVDYGETGNNSTWFLYDIPLKPDLKTSAIPENFNGNWFRSDNGQWEIGLMDSLAIYRSKVWDYVTYNEKDGLGTLKLRNGSQNLSLYLKSGENGICMIGENPSKLQRFTHEPNESVIPLDNEAFKMPVFKRDTAIYCGFVKDFNKRYPQRTRMVYVNDVLTGQQIPYTYKLSDNGWFEVKIPLTSPLMVIGSCYLEPGKRTFQCYENYRGGKYLYMGDGARINTDLDKLRDQNSFLSFKREKALDLTPAQYQQMITELLRKDLEMSKEYCREHRICTKAEKLHEMALTYRWATELLSYQMNFESAYRTKNKIPNTQRELPVKAPIPEKDYYSLLTRELLNNPYAVITSEYHFFINRLKFLESTGSFKSLTVPEVAREMVKSGTQLTSKEKELVKKMELFYPPEVIKLENDFNDQYLRMRLDYSRKYADKLQNLYKEKKEPTLFLAVMEEDYLLKQGIQFTESEQEMIRARKELENNPLVQKKNAGMLEVGKEVIQFNTDHRDFYSGLMRSQRTEERMQFLEGKVGLNAGLAEDIIRSQDICFQMINEMQPLSEPVIQRDLKSIKTPFIAEYILIKNNEVRKKNELSRLAARDKTGYYVRETPKTEAEKVFEGIIGNYKGKVVFVDFWATWCGPCRSGIEQMRPLKEELAKEDVVFVYITNPSSPKQTYDNMIPDIKGEHYRLTNDEFNVIAGKFKISGIPHYVLVGKDGKVINEHLIYMGNQQLKDLLLKYAGK